MLKGYDNRMLGAPDLSHRFVREGNRLIPQAALVRVRMADDEGVTPGEDGARA